MQLPISADVLFPLGAGVVALIIAMIAVVTHKRRARTSTTGPAESVPADRGAVRAGSAAVSATELTAADWTGERAAGLSDPPPAVPSRSGATPGRGPSTIAATRPRTVADAVAERDADTAPLPIRSDLLLVRAAARTASTIVVQSSVATAGAGSVGLLEASDATRDDATGDDETSGDAVSGASAAAHDASGAQSPEPGPPEASAAAHTPATWPGNEPTRPAGGGSTPTPAPDTTGPDAGGPGSGRDLGAEPVEPAQGPVDDPAQTAPGAAAAASAAGSSRAMADAVAQAMANRAAAARRAAAPAVPGPSAADAAATSRRADARDRLLAVLLDDPARAVGAVVELDGVREQLARLTDVVRHDREVVGQVLRKLADAGLDADQITRFCGLPTAEVQALIDSTGTG